MPVEITYRVVKGCTKFFNNSDTIKKRKSKSKNHLIGKSQPICVNVRRSINERCRTLARHSQSICNNMKYEARHNFTMLHKRPCSGLIFSEVSLIFSFFQFVRNDKERQRNYIHQSRATILYCLFSLSINYYYILCQLICYLINLLLICYFVRGTARYAVNANSISQKIWKERKFLDIFLKYLKI